MIFALPHSYGEERNQRTWSRFDTPQMAMGECYENKRDAILANYIRFAEDVDQGDALTFHEPYALAAGSMDGNAPAGSNEIDLAADLASSTIMTNGLWLTLSDYDTDTDLRETRGYGSIRAIDTAPTPDVVRRGTVINYTKRKLYVIWHTDDGNLDVALADATTSFSITLPWLFEKVSAATQTVFAYAQQAAKQKDFGLVQNNGRGVVKVASAVAARDVLYPTATAGQLDDELPATIHGPASATAVHAATVAGEVIEALIHAPPISKEPFYPEAFLRGQRRPGEDQFNLSATA